MKKLRFPHTLVLLFSMIIAAQALTYVLPSGQYERDGRRVIPDTYERVEKTPLEFHAFLTKIPGGMEKAADIIFFVFIIGGAIGVVRATGAIDALIGTSIEVLGRKRILLVGGMVGLFTLGSATLGMAEEYVPFMPILVTMCLALRMDAIVAMGIVYVGYAVGYGCAIMNPFTVLIGQDIAGLDPGSGMWYRAVLLLVCTLIGVHHLLRYARRVERDPSSSLVGDVDYSKGFDLPEDTRMTPSRGGVLVIFALAIVVFVYAVAILEEDWYLVELSALFLSVAIVAGFVGGLSPNRLAGEFCKGAGDLTTTALLIGFARTIELVLSDGQVIDTVIHGVSGVLGSLGAEMSAVGMLIVQTLCNFFIPSGSGPAYVTMPIMAPIADEVGISRQTAVLAYQMGDGFTNSIIPTNAVLMGMLALGRIPYQRWLRFMLPLLLKIYLVGAIALVVAVWMDY